MRIRFKACAVAWSILACVGCGPSDRPDFGNDGSTGADETELDVDDGLLGAAEDTDGPDGSVADGTDAPSATTDSTDGSDPNGSETTDDSPSNRQTDSQTDATGSDETDSVTTDSAATDVSTTDATGTDTAGQDPTPEDTAGQLGQACAQATDCASGFCADGVCCNSACGAVCSECNSSGTCVAAASDDACEDVECPAETECRVYELTNAGNCDALGACATAAACTSVDVQAGTPCANGEGACDGAGQCVIPNKATLGETCTDGDECGSDYCAATASGARVCCSEACDGVCEACGTDGFCDAAPADDSRCAPITCTPDSACADYPPALSSNRCVGYGQCITEAAYCVAEFSSATTSCGTGMFCDGAGSCEDACSSGEMWCTDECVDLSTDITNCGSCGNACSAPATPDSTAACFSGICAECGAYDQVCCPGAGTGCASGMACGGTDRCVCAVNTHRCNSGSYAGQCAANDNGEACGPSCVDCSQRHATPGCTADKCDNECLAESVCSNNSDGTANCGIWDFDANSLEGAVSLGPMPYVLTEYESGNYMFRFAYSGGTNAGNIRGSVRFPLCGDGRGTNVTGKKLVFDVLYDSSLLNSTAWAMAKVWVGSTSYEGTLLELLNTGVWQTLEMQLTTWKAPAGTNPQQSATDIEIYLGTGVGHPNHYIYIDNVRIVSE